MKNYYTTPEEVRAFTLIESVKSASDAEILKGIMLAQFKIEAYCNQFFYNKEEIKELDGTGSNLLVLPERLHEITSIFFMYQNANEKVSLAQDRWGVRLKTEVYFNYELRDKGERLPVFPVGISNIVISGFWGWKEVPHEVKYCANKLAEGLCLFSDDEDAIRAETGVFKKETIGDYSYELKDSKLLTETQSTGDTTVDSILKKHKRSLRRPTMRVGVV